MTRSLMALVTLLASLAARGELVDRISIVVEGRIIKHSDILQDIALTALMNSEKPSSTLAEQKKAAKRLIDQMLIRKELAAGLYASPAKSEVDHLLEQIQSRFGSEDAFKRTLAGYGLSEVAVRRYLEWQLSVLHFVNLRFAPTSQVSDEEARTYYQEHRAEFRKAGVVENLEQARPQIEQAVNGEKINKAFFTWLDESEKSAMIAYNEEDLK